jgi:hypothetical protein
MCDLRFWICDVRIAKYDFTQSDVVLQPGGIFIQNIRFSYAYNVSNNLCSRT